MRLTLYFITVLSMPGVAYIAASAQNRETALRYLRYAVIGKKPGGTLTVESIPPGARLFIDGADSGRVTPIVLAGLESELEHRIRLELPGEEPQTATVAIAAGERRTLTVLVESAMVYLRVSSVPDGAEVQINGRTAAFTPCTLPVRVGQPLALRVHRTGWRSYEESLVPARGRPLDRRVVLEKTEELLAAEAEEQEIRDTAKPTQRRRVRARPKNSSSRRRSVDEG